MVPSLPYYGMGCAVSGNVLYALGGNQGELGFTLDLVPDATWASFNTTRDIGMYPSLAPSENGMFVVGDDTRLQFFDSGSRDWNVGSPVDEQPTALWLARNDLIPTEYVTFANNSLSMFDSVRWRWNTHPADMSVKDYSLAVDKGIVHILDGFRTGNHGEIYSFDMRTSKWESANATGVLPPRKPNLSWAQHKENVYTVEKDTLYTLDLTKLKWTRHRIEGLNGHESGCLVYHNGHLIHAFGANLDNNRIQRIDINRFRLSEASSHYIIFIITCAFLFLTMAIFIYHKVTKSIPPKAIDLPEMLVQHIWSESDFSSDTINCNYYSEIDTPQLSHISKHIHTISFPIRQYMSNPTLLEH
ncbi:hypothetical protein DSO57_1017927 [Entomophthora muscae]|uniref:Uncharacterized protein n=1 Tax=Entomophthora muscae TaxID=34485 RepID=A0ACC2S6L2_9FUNG|nr:hypothetical protein DSO57_1017927 [Entomophthora muscae]